MVVVELWNRSGTQRIDIAVFGMACSHCRDTVATVVGDLDGVRSVDVDREQGRAEVAADATVSTDDVIEAVRAVGYEARGASAT